MVEYNNNYSLKGKFLYKSQYVSEQKSMKQEGMTFDHDFCYFILLFSSLLKKEGRKRENDVAKIVIKSHTFLFHPKIKIKTKFVSSKSL